MKTVFEASAQKGKPGHCFAAQVFKNGKAFITVDPTDDENEATNSAKEIADFLNNKNQSQNLDKVWRADYEIAKSVANNFEDILNQVDERLSYLEGHAHGDDGMIITELRGIIQKQIKH